MNGFLDDYQQKMSWGKGMEWIKVPGGDGCVSGTESSLLSSPISYCELISILKGVFSSTAWDCQEEYRLSSFCFM